MWLGAPCVLRHPASLYRPFRLVRPVCALDYSCRGCQMTVGSLPLNAAVGRTVEVEQCLTCLSLGTPGRTLGGMLR